MKRFSGTFLKTVVLTVLISGLLFSCMTAEGALFESVIGAVDDDQPKGQPSKGSSTYEESEGNGGTYETEEEEPFVEEIGIQVVTEPADAQVYLNNEYVGTGTVTVSPKPGNYQIQIKKSGYYPQTVWARYDGTTLVVVSVALQEITGYLYLEVEPPGTRSTANGQSISEGVTELKIGNYTVRVRKFGYEEWRGEVTILERNTTKVAVELKEAAFELSELDLSRRVFNPKNPGKLGTVKATFEVSSFGTGEFIVSDSQGTKVYTRPLREFTTWGQSVEWDGRDDNGRLLEDGDYTIMIDADGKKPGERAELKTGVNIDSTAVISFRSAAGGLSGTFFAPVPAVLPSGSFQMNAGMIGHYSINLGVGRYPTFAAARIGLGQDNEVDLQGALFVGPEEPVPYTAGVGFKHKLPGTGPFSFGVTGKLTYVGNTSIDTLHNYTGLSAGVIAALITDPLVLTLSPEIVVSPYSVAYPKTSSMPGFTAWGYGRVGILADFGALTAALSGSVRTLPFTSGFDLQPPYSAGAEVHWLVPGTQIVLSGYVVTEFDAVNYFYMMGGAGVGFIN